MNPTALQVHRDALIVDGLVFMGDGSTETLEAGNVAAANVTVCHFEADFEQACNEMAEWHARVAAPDSRWRLVERAADVSAARAAGQIGLIMGWQNARPLGDRLDRLPFFRHLEDCASHGELVRVTSALLERGWSEAELRGFLGENLLRALDLAWAPP